MKLPEERTRKDGEILDDDILKISSFLNHQVDPGLMMQVGAEFKRLFGNEEITKVLTCEASRVAPSIMVAYQLGVPMVFARKKRPSILNDAVYWADVLSHTEKANDKIYVEKKFLGSDDHLLIIGDFLAHGEAVKGVLNIVRQVDASVAGVGMVVAKELQSDNDWAKEHGYCLGALVKTANFENNQIYFVGEK